MRIDNVILINDHAKIEECYNASSSFFDENAVARRRVANHLWGFHEIMNLVPQTTSSFGSGHYFPIAEAYFQLECSYQLMLEGFYRQSLLSLRTVLELGLLQIFFAIDDQEEIAIQPWLSSAERTPMRRRLLDELRRLTFLQEFDEHFGFIDRIRDTFDQLDAYVHTRGRTHSGYWLSGPGCIRFTERSLLLCIDTFCSVISTIMTTLLLKYPIGMQALPLDEKFGFFGPMGGFLQEHQVELIRGLLYPEEASFIQRHSDKDEMIQRIVRHFENLPDLSPEKWKRQSDELDQLLASASKPSTTRKPNEDY